MQKPKQERPILVNENKNQERADTQVMRNSRSKNYGMRKVRKLDGAREESNWTRNTGRLDASCEKAFAAVNL
jgi:hypothetical protein